MSETKLISTPCSAEFIQIGWIAHGMDKTRHDNYKAMFGKGEVRVPPKIYKTEQVAARYGTPTPVFIKQNKEIAK